MGISGLLPFLESASKKCYINEFRGLTVAIDSYCWLHKGTFSCADKLVRGEHTDAYVKYCFKYINLLRSYNIKPILVFDGQHLPAKKETERKRREHRLHARNRATELLRLGKVEEARQYLRQSVNITHEMALALIKECRKNKIDCIVAPYEADAQLAYLNRCGIADVVITEDSDLILFGCSKIFFKFNLDGSGVLVEHSKLSTAMKMRPDQYTFDKFRYMCIISGCDYLDSLPGIGLKKAHKAVLLTHNPDIYKLLPRLPQYLNLSKLVVTEEYIENFKLADATIRHQVVYDSITRKQVPLTDPKDAGTRPEHLKNAGTIDESDSSFEMAIGNIDPISLKVMDNWNPDKEVLANDSIWSKVYKKTQQPQICKITPTKRTVKKDVPLADTALIQEQEMLAYEKKLEEELKVYHRTEPPPKRRKSDESSAPLEEKLEVLINNPFVKQKRLSKFSTTCVDPNQHVVSRFFEVQSTPSEKEESLSTILETESCGEDAECLSGTSSQEELVDERLSPILNITSVESFRHQFSKKVYKHSIESETVLLSCSSIESTLSGDITDSDSEKLTPVNVVDSEVVRLTNRERSQKGKPVQVKRSTGKVDLSRFRKANQPTISSLFNKMRTQS